MYISPQTSVGGTGLSQGFYGTTAAWGSIVPASLYPNVTASITYNTQTQVAQYYIGGVLQGSATLSAPQINYFYIMGWLTGDTTYIKDVMITSEPAP